ncbi:TPA: phage tail protein [Providencia rettgeri]|nr:phage tail protein [Providencia rettgeri]
MSQLNSLTQFIIDNIPDWASLKFRANIEDGTLIRAPKAFGLNQRRFGIFRYNAVLDWDDFPYRQYSAADVYALVLAWLDEHGNSLRDEFDLADPDVTVDFDEELTSPFVISVELADSIDAIPDKNGNIPYKGQRWRLVYPETYIATQGFLYAANESGAPLGG